MRGFMKDRNLKADDNWATPQWFYDELNAEFNFDFDPCPYNEGEIVNCGLQVKWGERNYINPPYSRKLKEQFVQKAVEVAKAGAICVMLLPVSTSTQLFHEVIKPNAKEIRFIKGRIKFQKKDDAGNWYTPKNGGMHDSMVVVFSGSI